MRPSWEPPRDSGLRWTWIDNSRPFIANGEVRVSQTQSTSIENDLIIVTMFNLDKLSDVRPEIQQGSTWEKGHIPKSLDSFVESLVHCVDRRRCHFKVRESSVGPRFLGVKAHSNGRGYNNEAEGLTGHRPYQEPPCPNYESMNNPIGINPTTQGPMIPKIPIWKLIQHPLFLFTLTLALLLFT